MPSLLMSPMCSTPRGFATAPPIVAGNAVPGSRFLLSTRSGTVRSPSGLWS